MPQSKTHLAELFYIWLIEPEDNSESKKRTDADYVYASVPSIRNTTKGRRYPTCCQSRFKSIREQILQATLSNSACRVLVKMTSPSRLVRISELDDDRIACTNGCGESSLQELTRWRNDSLAINQFAVLIIESCDVAECAYCSGDALAV